MKQYVKHNDKTTMTVNIVFQILRLCIIIHIIFPSSLKYSYFNLSLHESFVVKVFHKIQMGVKKLENI